ncbi:MAG: 50S ribosomal protein L4 [[Candidatus Thermochlorobacteriaceae] bacterium GBChlB]|jgi:large subunit ribosomal protein L4|nr:MAG: 50S ribosomal protein L4 [[Candidatus Thermochlorobacteriaceae] bacterium GBChlB]
MQVKVLKKDGSESGETVELNPTVFEIEPNDHAIYMDVRSLMANQRQGTHKVKSREEVRGGGKKPYRQKGTGGARRGTQRSPLMPGGGAIFGPRPHDYVLKVNRKMKTLARKSALSYKAKESAIVVVEDFAPAAIKTKEVAAVLKNLGLDGKKTLMLTAGKNEMLYKSGRNIDRLHILEANKAATYDILNSKVLLFQKSAVKMLEETLTKQD